MQRPFNPWLGATVIVVLIGSCWSAPAAQASHDLPVMRSIPHDPLRIDTGLVSGTLLDNDVKTYLGIPFADAPIRENRWRPPQPVRPWTGIYTADAMRPACMQRLSNSSIVDYFGQQTESEDCLYLNIWAPAGTKGGDRLPVIVYIHGGALRIMSASMPVYDGASLAARGVIYVAGNYRLGPLGFLALPQLTAESPQHSSGDYGMLDQVAELKWIQRNISAFGGDPSNVTLIGQSAGSESINNLQASPLTAGLFARAIGLSGNSVIGAFGATLPQQQAQTEGLKLMHAMHVTTLAQMRALSADRVLAIADEAHYRSMVDVDGYFLPDTPRRIFDDGRQQHVPILVGSTAEDIGTRIVLRSVRTVGQYKQLSAGMFGAQAAAFLKVWPASTDAEAQKQALEVAHDSGLGLGAIEWATLNGADPTYLYLFTHIQPFAAGVTYSDFVPATAGAYHFGDVPYWLGTLASLNLFRHERDWGAVDWSLSSKMQDVIIAFATKGDPNTAEVKFVRFSRPNEIRAVLGQNGSSSSSLQKLNVPGINFLLAHQSASAPQGAGCLSATCPPAGDRLPQ